MHHEIRRASEGKGEKERERLFGRGSEGFTRHHITERARTPDAARTRRLEKGNLKLLTDQKFVVVIKKKIQLSNPVQKEEYPQEHTTSV